MASTSIPIIPAACIRANAAFDFFLLLTILKYIKAEILGQSCSTGFDSFTAIVFINKPFAWKAQDVLVQKVVGCIMDLNNV